MSIGFLEGAEYEIATASRQICDACGLPFTDEEWDDRHSHHKPGCPFGTDADEDDFDMEEYTDLESAFDALLFCDCDVNYHDECCPVCNENASAEENADEM